MNEYKKNSHAVHIWVIIEFFSMGMLSYFYSDMKTEDKKHFFISRLQKVAFKIYAYTHQFD